MKKHTKSSFSQLLNHETKRGLLLKFILLSFILIGYFIYMSFKFGTTDGFFVTVLTWTFFVFCTPIADAGLLLALPVRLVVKVRMMYTQLASFIIAFFLNFYAIFFTPIIYTKTAILNLFYHILTQPFPFWGIIFLSILGTLFSVYFGDELMDVAKHSDRKKFHKHKLKHKIIITIFIFTATLILYNFLLQRLDITIGY